ncbi:hypothetical protein CROQUDRAFT_65699 [Cronartium quercuum f. sp. fusiforme G11]|uniref:U6 snRNA-associated Sm-like protein LSm1 n=1 Tax=Cronartium quercuum f. sp. fusiforme G11 TaxID=708437 RepID=A0A9P6NGQ2_9BASI|nr:hypothetical protein CROQUDRAFT_65699 [Cronartium quercuum f. sp. fusiforme G11]
MDNFLTNLPFTTSGALVDTVDKKILVSLRDGRKLIGVLRSYDQFANLVLQDTIERVHVEVGNSETKNQTGSYTDIWRGVYIIRGENVVLLGEIDLDKEDEAISKCEKKSIDTILSKQANEQMTSSKITKEKEKILFNKRGFGKEGDEGDRY